MPMEFSSIFSQKSDFSFTVIVPNSFSNLSGHDSDLSRVNTPGSTPLPSSAVLASYKYPEAVTNHGALVKIRASPLSDKQIEHQ
jgi:hypothetical protein